MAGDALDRALHRLIPARAGHFRLASGHHGELWLDLDALFLRPVLLRPFAAALANRLAAHAVRAVCGPLTGGAFLAQLLAAELDAEFLHAGRAADGSSPVRYRLPDTLRPVVRGKRVAVVDDVINAGSAVRATVADLAASGADVVALGALLVLGDAADSLAAELGVPLEALARRPASLWPPAECPLCAAGVPLEEPRC